MFRFRYNCVEANFRPEFLVLVYGSFGVLNLPSPPTPRQNLSEIHVETNRPSLKLLDQSKRSGSVRRETGQNLTQESGSRSRGSTGCFICEDG